MTSTCPACRPISSLASRSAVNSGLGSAGSARPPGKLICPEWLRSWEVRCVNRTVRPPGCATIGTSTEAGVIAPSPPASSSPYTESTGRERRRSRSLSPAGSSSIKGKNHEAVCIDRRAGSRQLGRIRLPLPRRHEEDRRGAGQESAALEPADGRGDEVPCGGRGAPQGRQASGVGRYSRARDEDPRYQVIASY